MNKRLKNYFLSIIIVLVVVLSRCATSSGTSDILSLEQAIEQSAEDITGKLPRAVRVAIVAFSSEHNNLSEYIMDELTGALVDRNLEVADRRNLAFVYKELNFQTSGDVNDETAVSIGKFLGAQYVIFGQLVPTGRTARYRTSSVNVETSIQETSTRLTVHNDRTFRNFVVAIEQNPVTPVVADYERQSTGSESAGAYLDKGILHAIRGDYELAIIEFTEAINLDNNLAAAWLLRGRAFSASVSDIINVFEDFEGFSAYVQDGDISTEQRTGYEKAITDFTEAIRIDPNLQPAFKNRGAAYIDLGDYNKALADFNIAIRLNPNDPEPYQDRGVVYSILGDKERALADYNRAISVDPNYVMAYSVRGNLYVERGDYDRAVIDFNHVIRLNPDYETAYYRRGLTYYYMEDNDRALIDFNHAIRLNPDYENAYYARGLTYYSMEDNDRAIIDFNHAIRLDPNNIDAYFQRGIVYLFMGDYDRAIIDFTHVIRLDPNYKDAYYYRGLAYSVMEDNDRALIDFNHVIRLDPNDRLGYYNRAVTYSYMGDYDRAIIDYTHVIRLNPNDKSAYSGRGDEYYNKQDFNRAISDYESALRLDPNDTWVRDKLEKARRLRGR